LASSPKIDHPQSVEYVMDAIKNTLTLTWSAIAGASYHVQSRHGLRSPWHDVDAPVQNGSTTLTMIGESQQFQVIRREEVSQ
jgi:hypothetical protein